MPELPEIEHLKRTLEPTLAGGRVRDVRLHRPDILTRQGREAGRGDHRAARGALLAGATIERLERHGKQLAIIAEDGRVIGVHLGMSGQLRYLPPRRRMPDAGHVHCVWWIENAGGRGRLAFRDPRRFGGLWSFETVERLYADRWSGLGPDALRISAPALARRLARTTRAIKAALLDQKLIAGVGNIYADESLFDAAVHPLTPSHLLAPPDVRRLAASIRRLMRQAVRAGGSTIDTYVDGNGHAGSFSVRHKVYGRAGQPCMQCDAPLAAMAVAQRTTVVCERCQPVPVLDNC